MSTAAPGSADHRPDPRSDPSRGESTRATKPAETARHTRPAGDGRPDLSNGNGASPGTRVAGERRRRPSARMAISGGVALLTLVAAVVTAIGLGGTDNTETANVGLPPATATVARGTLTQIENVAGTLGYGEVTVVSARSGLGSSGSAGAAGPGAGSAGQTATSSGGTWTWLPVPGTIIRRGQAVYRVDERPIPLIYGPIPPYRVLAPGLTGADVAEFERNLAALGYSGFTIDDTYTSATASAVRRWQSALGLDQTGEVDVNQVVVAGGPIRVAEIKAALGVPASGPVLGYTGTTRVVTVALDVARQHLVRKGIAATVTLPDGSTVDGTVDTVGTVATTSTGGAGGGGATTTIDVVVQISDQAALGTLDAAPVTVALVSAQRQGVLIVPVGALVALAEGGYGVQVVDGSSSHYVAVQPGMFAGGRVEISGDGIAEGTIVGMPRS